MSGRTRLLYRQAASRHIQIPSITLGRRGPFSNIGFRLSCCHRLEGRGEDVIPQGIVEEECSGTAP